MPLYAAVPTPDKGYLLCFSDTTEVMKVDQRFAVNWRKDLQEEPNGSIGTQLSVSPDGRRIGITEIDKIRILDDQGEPLFVHHHREWEMFTGTQCFFQLGLAWFVTPNPLEGEDDVLHVMNAETFDIIDKVQIPDHNYNAYSFFDTPSPDMIILQSAAGQDEGFLFSIQLVNGAIKMIQIEAGYDRVMGSFSPDGTELVTAPHYNEEIEVLSFPDFNLLRSVEQDILWESPGNFTSENDEDAVDYVVFYLNNESIVVKTRWGRFLVLNRQSLKLEAELMLEGNQIKAFDFEGDETNDEDQIFDYEGEINDIKLNPYTGQFFAIHPSGMLMIYNR